MREAECKARIARRAYRTARSSCGMPCENEIAAAVAHFWPAIVVVPLHRPLYLPDVVARASDERPVRLSGDNWGRRAGLEPDSSTHSRS